jgi:peptide/nickel transport system substrate-binding protein
MERLWGDNWTTDPSVFSYQVAFRPGDDLTGQLAQSWELTSPSTLVVHLRQGIKWQDIPPANGREFTADDIAYDFNRLYGLGGYGFTTGSPGLANNPVFHNLKSVTATETYTDVFQWNISNSEMITEPLQTSMSSASDIFCPDAVKEWGNLDDWHHAIGTGPFILTDFVSGSSATLVKNPNYWGYDERYPQNRLPYIDTLKVSIIPDEATALAGLRSGKITVMAGISRQDATDLQKTNPDLLQTVMAAAQATTIDVRNDRAPFDDIRVREAMQMAIPLQIIAATYYDGTCSPNPSPMTSTLLTGWTYPYSEWSQDLKNTYAYNPTEAKQLLSEAGHPNGFNTDIVVDNTEDSSLLQIVKSYFEAVNINMTIKPMDSPSWVNLVLFTHGEDALFLKGGSLGLTYEPSVQVSRFQTGSGYNPTMVSDPKYDAFVTQAMAATSTDEFKQILINMNEYVAQQHYVISLLVPNLFAFSQPSLKGYNGQFGAIESDPSFSPAYLYFYLARFWIEQN